MQTPHATRLAAVSLALLIAGCGDSKQTSAPPPAPAVTVAVPVSRNIVDQDEYVGRFVAIDAVEVRARVSGYLDRIHFTDGQIVKQGDLLFTIDKRPFQTALDQAQANLAQARANLAFTEADLARASQLVRDKTITEQTFDQRTQAKRVAEASVAAQEAAVRQASLDLEFTELRAPVAGRIGDRRVSPGNLVTGGAGGVTTLLATIVSVDPIRFEFTLDEASFLRYERFSGASRDMASRHAGMDVSLKLIDEADFSHPGQMDFMDNVIDRATGTIRGRAVFSNSTGMFTPGMFGRIRVPGSPAYTALLVPDVAIGSEQIRKFVYAVDGENVARVKYVTLGDLVDRTLRVVKAGLAPDDRVVVNGMARIRPGVKVTPTEESVKVSDQPQAPPSSASSPKTE
jgi:RND family efflux transporter MFP subunit